MTFEKWLEQHGGTYDDDVKNLMKAAFDAGWNEGYDEGQEDAQDAGLPVAYHKG